MSEQQKAIIDGLNSIIPNPYTPGQWYDAQMNGGAVQVRRTRSTKGGSYLHIRRRGVLTVRHYQTNEIEHSQASWINFRVNLETYEIKGL
jgi:hypothetical protein